MTTTTHRPPTTTSSPIFQWRSLKIRVTISMLIFLLVGIWSLSFYASYTLQSDLEQALGEQQFSTVSIIASDINDELDERLKSLEMIAAKITPAMLDNAASVQTFLESHVSFPNLFNYGGIVLRLDGVAIAEVPNHGRIGINYSDRDYMIEVLKGKTTISNPVMGKTSRSPFFSMLTPIRDAKGKIMGVLAGATDLITDNKYGKTGGYLLVSPKIRTIVFATDKKRIMEVYPAPGVNPLIDRFIEGYEGSGVAVNPLGVEVLASAKGIPVSGWYVTALMPTEEAFAPIHAMQRRILLATIFLTLLAGGLTWWMLKRQLAPVFATIKTLAALADTDESPQPLPITRQDEIGELIGGFNHLLETLGQQKEVLRESELFNRSLVENLPDYIIVYGTDGKILYVNPATEMALGYNLKELVGTSVLSHIAEERRDEVISNMKVRQEGREVPVYETDIVAKDGYRRPVIVKGTPIRHHDNPAFLVLLVDITERRQAEVALRDMHWRLESIIEGTHIGTWEWNVQTGETVFNEVWAQIIGHTLNELAPISIKTWETFSHPDDLEQSAELLERHFAGELPYYDYECRMKHKDGHWVWVRDRGRLITRTDDGKPLMMFGTHTDITARKQAEEKIKASILEKETLLKEIHHRVKNNLTVISSLLDLQSSCLQDENAREALQNSIERVKTMALIHTQLYQSPDLARINFGQFIRDLIGNIIQSYGRAESPVAINVDADEISLGIDASIPCGLILNELVANALKHAFPEGKEGEINIRMRSEDKRVSLTVQDNGIGFPESLDVTKLKSLGLELVNLLVGQISGKMEMQVDGGTTWTITFPLKDEREWRNG
jgi:PAS domain S-box-containing protein